MDSDERFKHLAADPRFKPLRKKQKKVEIDDRFKSMFEDKCFTLKYSKDKRGRNQKKTTGDDLKKYYSLKEENKEKEEDDDDDKDEDDGDDTEEVSSSSDEAESDEDNTDDVDKIKFDWEPLDHDADHADKSTKRIAVQNFDWNHLNANDIFTIINSVRRPLSVKVFISEFGKERLEREEIEGPQELVDMPVIDEVEEEYNELKSKMDSLQAMAPNQYEDAEEDGDLENDEVRERIRRYELNRLKYYFGVVEFDSVESAELVYKELDGLEYEGSSMELDLRYIPDDMEFDDSDLKSRCDSPPDLTVYKAPQFINTALQQTKVEFSWDQTDINRQGRLQKSYTKAELEKDDLDVYLASDSDKSDEEENEDKDQEMGGGMNKYKKLMKDLEDEKTEKSKVEVGVSWDAEFSSDDNLCDDGKSSESEDDSSKSGGERFESDDEADGSHLEDAGLEMLVMDSKPEEFKFKPDDERFKAIYESRLFNIDPSHPKFKKTEAYDMIAETKRKRKGKSFNK